MGVCDTEKAIYWTFVTISLLLTFGLGAYRRKQRNFVENPGHGKKILFSMAAVKMIIGALLMTVLYPVDCLGFSSIYGGIAFIIGFYWLVLAMQIRGNGQTNTNTGSEMPKMSANANEMV